jgi:hypothetical protein
MDIISYSKAMKAKKAIGELDSRLGKGDSNKNGELDIVDVHASTKVRLEELEKKRRGILDERIVIETNEDFQTGIQHGVSLDGDKLTGSGTWEVEINLGEDSLEFDSVDIRTLKKNPSDVKKIERMKSNDSPIPWKATTNQNTDAYLLFNDATYYSSAFLVNAVQNIWVQLDFGEGNEKTIAKYDLSNASANDTGSTYANRAPAAWSIQGSHDEAIWTTLDEQHLGREDWGGYRYQYEPITNSFTINAPQPFRFYRLYVHTIVNPNDGRCAIGNLSFYESSESTYSEYNNDFTGVTVEIDSGEGYQEIDSNRMPTTYFTETPKLKVTLDGTRELDILAFNYKARPVLNRVSEVESNTNINLLKHNLRVDSILNKRRYSMKEMIVDDFEDASGIDSEKSTNIMHDAESHKVTQENTSLSSEALLITEELDYVPTMFTLSAVTTTDSTAAKDIDMSSGTFTNTEVVDGELVLTSVDGNFAKSGSWESGIIDMGDNFKSFVELSNIIDKPEETSIKVLTSTSMDGVTFEEFREVLGSEVASSIGRYVKVRVELTAKETILPEREIMSFTAEEIPNFTENENIILDGGAKLKTSFTEKMTVDGSFAGEGVLLRAPIRKLNFKSIEKVEVK